MPRPTTIPPMGDTTAEQLLDMMLQPPQKPQTQESEKPQGQ